MPGKAGNVVSWFDKCSIHYACSVSTYDALRFDFTVVSNVLINIIQKLNNHFLLFRSRVHEYAELTRTPEAEILQLQTQEIYKSEFVHYKVKILSF